MIILSPRRLVFSLEEDVEETDKIAYLSANDCGFVEGGLGCGSNILQPGKTRRREKTENTIKEIIDSFVGPRAWPSIDCTWIGKEAFGDKHN